MLLAMQDDFAARADAAADLALGLCVLLRAPDVLWTDIFPRYQEAGCSAVFLQRLQPRILAGQLPSPAPEVVQVNTSPSPIANTAASHEAATPIVITPCASISPTACSS